MFAGQSMLGYMERGRLLQHVVAFRDGECQQTLVAPDWPHLGPLPTASVLFAQGLPLSSGRSLYSLLGLCWRSTYVQSCLRPMLYLCL